MTLTAGQSQPLAEELVVHLFRHHSARIIASLTRVFGSQHLQLAEDVVQDAMIRALQLWPFQGVPDNPAAWLTQVAKRRALDLLRRDVVWAEKQAELERLLPQSTAGMPSPNDEIDDQLALILMCCHPAIARDAQLALTLKVACGFSVPEIARALLAEPDTIAKRIVRAKRQIREQGIAMELPAQLDERLESALHVVYLLFNEGYGATQGENLLREDLCVEAIRLGQLLAAHPRTNTPSLQALLALLMLQAARLPARTSDSGALTLLAEQDRTQWNRALIAAGMRHLAKAAAGDVVTRYHLQAEIAALHVAAASDAATDWPTIAARYEELYQLDPSPIVALNRAVAVARSQGAVAGLRLLAEIEDHPALRKYYLLPAVLADLWRQAGDAQKAAQYYRQALAHNCTEPERQFLQQQLERLATG